MQVAYYKTVQKDNKMQTVFTDILIIGAGAAGMAAALAAEKKGYAKILLAERNKEPGGILLQCIHNGFGLGYFKEDLTGVQYAERFRKLLYQSKATVMCGTMVLKLNQDRTALLSNKTGLTEIHFKKCVLATGCRERTLQSLDICGTRPAGIMTCGTAQKLMNVDGLEAGDDIIILGTGDVGQIMARQLIRAGKNVITMIEKESSPGGLKRNQENCLKAYHVPVMLNTQITSISGSGRIDGVQVRHTDTGKEEFLKCSTLLTAIGMIPETELAKDLLQPPEANPRSLTQNPETDPRSLPQTPEEKPAGCPSRTASLPDWLILTGNCDYVHDIVDSVTTDALNLANVL